MPQQAFASRPSTAPVSFAPSEPALRGPVPRAVFERRLASLQEWMRGQGLEALVVFGHGSALAMTTRSHGNLRYLLGWDPDFAQSVMVLPATGLPGLVVANIFAVQFAQEQAWLPHVRFAKGPAMAKEIASLLPAGAKRIGLVGRDEIPFVLWNALAGAGAADWIDCTAEISRRRAMKDETELGYHRAAAQICDEMFERLGPALRSGAPVFRIQVELENHARSRGAELCRTWLTVGKIPDRCRFGRDENLNIPREGDQALLGIMLILQGHWGHAIRTGALGRPTPANERIFAETEGLHRAMADALKPGADLAVVGNAGVIPPREGLFQFRSGHALGHSYEDPAGTPEFPQPYEGTNAPPSPARAHPGMLFELHPNIFVAGEGAASIGDMALVTESGHEFLTNYPRHLLIF